MIWEKLMGAIVATLFGGVFILFFKRIGTALALSDREFWKNIGMKASANESYITFAKYLTLFIGVVVFVSGMILFVQFFKGLK